MKENIKYFIEDEWHAELQEGEFDSFEDALNELKNRSLIPWNIEPNIAPCESQLTCGRRYEIIETDITKFPSTQVKRTPVLEVSSKEVKWLIDLI